MLAEVDHSIATLTEAQVVTIPPERMEALVEVRPSLPQAFWWTQLVDEGVLRAMIVSMGRRTSLERVAHLLCELCFRMRNIGIATEQTFVMPFTQIVLADAVVLTPVHVNRVVRKLCALGALDLGVGTVIRPQPHQERGQHDDQQRVDRLKPGGGYSRGAERGIRRDRIVARK